MVFAWARHPSDWVWLLRKMRGLEGASMEFLQILLLILKLALVIIQITKALKSKSTRKP